MRMMGFKELCERVESQIEAIYSGNLSMDEVSKFAAELLTVRMTLSEELKKSDLDARMRKSGLKAIKAAIYMDTISKADKKPTEAQIEHTINMHELVAGEQDKLDQAEAQKANLERYDDVFKDAHVYCRQISNGKFE